MLDGAEVVSMALADFGRDAEVGGNRLRVLDCLTREAAIEAGYMDIDGPFLIASRGAVDALDIKFGDAGDRIVVSGQGYTVKSIRPDAMGMVLILLGPR